MQNDQQLQDEQSPGRRKRTWKIVIVHLVIVVMFFVAAFVWGNFE